MPLKALLRADDLWVEGNRQGRPTPVLRAIDLTIQTRQFTVLLGESGAGKTMLAKALSGLLPEGFRLSRGRITYRGTQLTTPSSFSALRGCNIFYTPQNAAASLNPVLTIGRQLNETRRIRHEQLLHMLAEMGFPDPPRILEAYPFMLSGGENQRCLLAMALASRCELLILDEPTSELDASAQQDFIRLLRASQLRLGLTVLLISHQLDLVRDIADNLLVMCTGAIVDSGTFAGVLAAPRHAYSRQIAAYLAGP